MKAINFEKEFEACTHLLKGFAFNLTNDPVDADDLYQDTAYLAFKNKHRFQPGTNLKAWLCTIMKNKFINHYRKKRREGLMFDKSEDYSLIDTSDHIAENDGVSNIGLAEVEQLINGLDVGQKMPFLMAFEGYQYNEIADEMELPLGTVKSRIFLAKKNLKKKLNVMNTVAGCEEFIAA